MPFEELRDVCFRAAIVVAWHFRAYDVNGRFRSVCRKDQIAVQQAVTNLPRGPVLPRDFVPNGVDIEQVGGVVDLDGPVGL